MKVCLQVPKMLKSLRQDWAPRAFVISFKLETDENLLIKKVMPASHASSSSSRHQYLV